MESLDFQKSRLCRTFETYTIVGVFNERFKLFYIEGDKIWKYREPKAYTIRYDNYSDTKGVKIKFVPKYRTSINTKEHCKNVSSSSTSNLYLIN